MMRTKVLNIIFFLSSISASGAFANSNATVETVEKILKTAGIAGTQIICESDIEDNDKCPPVHVSPWCEEQYKLLKNGTKLNESPFFNKNQKSLVFLGEEHGDEQAYSYYEKLLTDEKAGFDCLFLELPSVFQKNFDDPKGIVHARGSFERLDEKKDGEVSRLELKDFGYMSLLESLVQKARSRNVKVLLVDNSNLKIAKDEYLISVAARNEAMASNILDHYQKGRCQKGLSIKGAQHLFAKNESKGLEPVDKILKNKLKDLDPKDQLVVKKAMVYSPTSSSLLEAMGPCSWLNLLPKEKEAYYDQKSFFKTHDVFPEKIKSSMKESYGTDMDNEIDYAVVLPAQLDKAYLLEKLNKDNVVPKRHSSLHEIKKESTEVPLALRANASSLGISGMNSIHTQCSEICKKEKRNSMLIFKDVLYQEPTLKCEAFHPSRTNGAPYAPIYHQNATFIGNCYCTSKL
jgi:hypothetical protein